MEGIADIRQQIERNMLLPNIENINGLENAIWSTRLVQPLMETFKCMICRDLSRSPVVIAECCKQILGCRQCLDSYNGLNCPHCRAENYLEVDVNAFNGLLTLLHDHAN